MTLNFRAKNLKKQVCNFLPKNCNYFLWRENSKTILHFFQKKKKKKKKMPQSFLEVEILVLLFVLKVGHAFS